MFYVYILKNGNGRHYIGYTSIHPEDRLKEHNQSKSRWTRHKGLWSLLHYEQYETKVEAFQREKQLKRYKGGRAFRELISRKGARVV